MSAAAVAEQCMMRNKFILLVHHTCVALRQEAGVIITGDIAVNDRLMTDACMMQSVAA
jgi:hypothetical protein